MITAFNATNSEQYKLDLFARAMNALNGEKTPEDEGYIYIRSLNDYFVHIKDLYDIDPKFTVLPLDEETFNIDANTRVINIPAAFKKNGLGVQGDNYAETIYFMVDRYFDNMDLARDDIKIQIQYEVFDEKGRPIKKDIPAIIKDTQRVQNKLIFGWQINTDVTERAGNVRFSVRFYKIDEETGEVVYSLSTQTATIGIGQALDFDVTDFNQDDPTVELGKRLVGSVGDKDPIAAVPVFIVNLPDPNTGDKVDLQATDDGDLEYNFTTLAYAPGEGEISYEWFIDGVSEDQWNDEENTPEMVKILSTDSYYNPAKAYYYKDELGQYRYWVPNSTDFKAQELYEDRNAFTATHVGEYFVRAKSQIKNSIKRTDGKRITIPGPETPKDIVAGEQKIVIDVGENQVGRLNITANKGDAGDAAVSYEWYLVNANPNVEEPTDFTPEGANLGTESTLEVTQPGWYTAMIVGNRNGANVKFASNKYYRVTDIPETNFRVTCDDYEKVISINEIATVEVVMPEGREFPRYDELIYQWYRLDENGVRTAIEGFNTDTFDPAGDPAREFRGATITCGVKAIYNDIIGGEVLLDGTIDVTELGDPIRPESEIE